MEAIIAQVKSLAASLDDAGRRALVDALFDQQCALEKPFDAVRRMGNGHLELAVARVAVDLGIFKSLATAHEGRRVDELAKESGAAPELLASILRFLASVRIIEETDKDVYAANNFARAMARPEYEASLSFFFDFHGHITQALPDHLRKMKYSAVSESPRTALQTAFDTDLSSFEYLAMQQPQQFANLQQLMMIQRTKFAWFDGFASGLESWKGGDNKVAFVDIGGGRGQQCLAVKEKFLHLTGHIVLQDLPEALNALGAVEGVQLMPHDFFKPQPVYGATFYYLRQVMHDWTDANCVKILQQIVPAMDASSRILIDEVVVPDTRVNWQVAQMDMLMLASFGARERTQAEWHALCQQAGLKIEVIEVYDGGNQNAVIVAAVA